MASDTSVSDVCLSATQHKFYTGVLFPFISSPSVCRFLGKEQEKQEISQLFK